MEIKIPSMRNGVVSGTGSTDREPTLAFQQEQQNAAGDPKMLYKILVTK